MVITFFTICTANLGLLGLSQSQGVSYPQIESSKIESTLALGGPLGEGVIDDATQKHLHSSIREADDSGKN